MLTTDDIARYKTRIGVFLQIPNVGRGQLKFVGVVENKPGYYAGIDLLANVGKNNGSFNGIKYFDCEYPSSGLFIQLEKIRNIIEQTFNNDKTTLTNNANVVNNDINKVENCTINMLNSSSLAQFDTPNRNNSFFDSINNDNIRINNGSGNTSSPVSRKKEDLTPILDKSVASANIKSTEIYNLSVANGSNTSVLDFSDIKECQSRIIEQNCRLQKYEKLLNEQSHVLEEIQPIVDEYIEKVHILELTIKNNRKEYEKTLRSYEHENKQLTDVVSELHDELKNNEQRLKTISTNTSAITPNNNDTKEVNINALQQELNELKKYKEAMKTSEQKWDNEKEQLKIHIELLNKKYHLLHKELLNIDTFNNNDQGKNDDQSKLDTMKFLSEIESLRMQLNKEKTEKLQLQTELDKHQSYNQELRSMPVFAPITKVDVSAGRKLWCVLCERAGHESLDCPYQYTNTKGFSDANNAENHNNQNQVTY